MYVPSPFQVEDADKLAAFIERHSFAALITFDGTAPFASQTDDADLGLWCGPNFVNLKKGEASLGAYAYDAILPKLREEFDKLIEAKQPAATK